MAYLPISTPSPEAYYEVERKAQRLAEHWPNVVMELHMPRDESEFPVAVQITIAEIASNDDLRRAYEQA